MRSLGVGSQGEHPPWAQGAGRHDYQGKHTMKTDDLIAMLSTNTEAVDRKLGIRTGWSAVLSGDLAAGARAPCGGPRRAGRFADWRIDFFFTRTWVTDGVSRQASTTV